jgi:hypothetical protein
MVVNPMADQQVIDERYEEEEETITLEHQQMDNTPNAYLMPKQQSI